MDDVRALEPLWPLRQRRHAVIACLDDPAELERLRPQLAGLRAELIVEWEPGPLSRALGRPSVTVASKFGRIGWRGQGPARQRVLEALEAFELECPECGPQAWGDPGAGAAASVEPWGEVVTNSARSRNHERRALA